MNSVRGTLLNFRADGQNRRPESASLPGFDEDNPSAERSYWEPSVAGVGLVSAEMVKLKARTKAAKYRQFSIL